MGAFEGDFFARGTLAKRCSTTASGTPASRATWMPKGLEGDRDETVDRITFGDAPARTSHDIQLGLFAPAAPDPVLEEIRTLDLDNMTPVEALQKLAELRGRAGG